MIRRFLRILGSGISITLMVALGFSLLVWFLGPLISIGEAVPWASTLSRLITIGIFVLLSLTAILIIVLRGARKEKTMAEDIVETADTTTDDDSELVQEELGELKGKLKTAMTALRKSKLGRRSLYELPWYVMIGPPGAGKTTAIVNSGLKFPLADSLGKEAIGGVGGTRNCDWWFTENAVMIDTAGRYTTQESAEVEDNAGWLGFLNLLKKHRKRQPINGAIIAISLSDLSMQDSTTQLGHAAAIRRRLNELREKLGVRFPIYVLFTKSDLIAGFAEFFDNLAKEDREQVWGFTLPLPKKGKDAASPIAAFDVEFGALLALLNAQSLERMQHETDPSRRSLISNFPSQVASVRSTADAFLQEIFQDSRFEDRHLLRGVYFTSGTQEGAPIDRLMMGMARTFGIGRQAIGAGQGAGRSYFLTRLFDSVIFGEAGLVSADDKVERRYRWTKRGAIAAAVLGAIGVGGLLGRSYLGNADLLAQATDQISAYQAAAAQIPPSPIEDSDIPSVVPALNILRDMPANSAVDQDDPEGALRYGLYQGAVVGNEAAQTYRAALNENLLPRLLLRLEDQIQANMNNPDFLYEVLKVYLMLGHQGPMNQDLIRDWMRLDWSVAYPGDDRAVLREDLAGHLDALLAQPMDTIALNGPMVDRIQTMLSQMSLAQRVYNGIIGSSAAADLPVWRLTDVGGPNLSRAIVRSSGAALSDGVDGIYTRAGFHDVFLAEALGVAERVQRESWVLGQTGEVEQSQAALANLSRDVLDLYYTDYLGAYDKLLGDVDIIPMENLAHAVEVTNILSSSSSPMANILRAVSAETLLSEAPPPPADVVPEGVTDGVAAVVSTEVLSNTTSRNQLLLQVMRDSIVSQGGAPPPPPGAYVQDRFAWLHDLTTGIDEQPSQLDTYLNLLINVYLELQSMQTGDTSGAAAGNATAILKFREFSEGLVGPLKRWSTQITSGSSGITADGTRSSINALWQSEVLPFCTQALNSRYPFDPRAEAEVGTQDFARLFGPGGMIDGFFDTHLREYVDTRARPWAWKTVNDTDLGISPAVLQQFQYAAQIRDAFFSGGPQPEISFQLTPEALDPNADQITVEVDGKTLLYLHNQPLKPTAFTWPGDVGQAAAVLQPMVNGTGNALRRDGPWALFRLLDTAEMRATTASDRTRVIFNIGGRIAIFNMQSGSVLNPFALPALKQFSCPTSF